MTKCIYWSLAALLLIAGNGCATDNDGKSSATSPDAPKVAPVDVYLTPLEGFDHRLLSHLALQLSKDLKLNVRVTSSFNIGDNEIDAKDGSFSVYKALDRCGKIVETFPNRKPDSIIILFGYLKVESEEEDGLLNYVVHSSENRAALIPYKLLLEDYIPSSMSSIRLASRLYKITKQEIGLLYLGYSLNDDPTSLMYGGVKSLRDLDAMGNEFPDKPSKN